jgi:hypothetical protein
MVLEQAVVRMLVDFEWFNFRSQVGLRAYEEFRGRESWQRLEVGLVRHFPVYSGLSRFD